MCAGAGRAAGRRKRPHDRCGTLRATREYRGAYIFDNALARARISVNAPPGILPGVPPDTRARLLIAPDRDGAESAAEAVVDAGLAATPPRIVREALAGEDDAEDAQWLAVVAAPGPGWTTAQLATLTDIAADHDGWTETDAP